MRKTFISSILLLSTLLLQAQTVVIKEEVNKISTDTIKSKKEDKIAFGFIFDFTFYGGANQKGIEGTLANSLGANFNWRLKYKLHKQIAAIAQLGVNFEKYGFKKTAENDSFPNNNNNSVEAYQIGALTGGLGLKFSIKKKSYLEIGALGKWNFTRDLYVEKKDVNGNVNETTIKDLNYINKFNYDAYARLGYKAISVVAYYRLNDMFSTSNIAPKVYEMPRLRLGVSLGF